MRRLLVFPVLFAAAAAFSATAQDKKKEPPLPPDSFYRLKTKSLAGKDVDLKEYAGKVVLIVNLASQ